MKDLIKKLVEAHGPSGFEDGVRDLIRPEIEPHVDEMYVDALGNLIGVKKGDGSGLKVMVAAHMDEIGVMVTHVTKKGFLRFTNIGGVHPRTLLGARVQFSNGTVGVVHSDRLEGQVKLHPIDKHFIDVGAAGREACPVRVGDPASFMRPFLVQGSRLTAKSMDDRIGCATAIEALKRLSGSPNDVYFVFSVQEEVGVRGAQVAANGLNPDVGIALDHYTLGASHAGSSRVSSGHCGDPAPRYTTLLVFELLFAARVTTYVPPATNIPVPSRPSRAAE